MSEDKTGSTFETALLQRLDRLEAGMTALSASGNSWSGPANPAPDRAALLDQRLAAIEMRLLQVAEGMPRPRGKTRILPSPLLVLTGLSLGLVAYAVFFGEVYKLDALPQISAGLEKIERLLR